MRLPSKLAALTALACACTALAQTGNARAEKLARGSKTATEAIKFLESTAVAIKDEALKKAATELLANPRPTFLKTPDAKQKALKALIAEGLLEATVTADQLFMPLPEGDAAPQPFLAAPGQAPGGHHAYPGGLAEHTAFNVRSAQALAANYVERYGVKDLDPDLAVAAAILHDAMKPWCLQWHADGSETVQPKLAGTASHHPLIVAEAFARKLPPDFIVVLASAHESPFVDGGKAVAGYLRAGAILAGVDPVAVGVLTKDGKLARPPRMEALIHHLSDHDYVLTDPTAKLTDDALNRLGDDAGVLDRAKLTWMRHRLQTRLPGVVLYRLWSTGGDAAIAAELKKQGLKLNSSEDAVK